MHYSYGIKNVPDVSMYTKVRSENINFGFGLYNFGFGLYAIYNGLLV